MSDSNVTKMPIADNYPTVDFSKNIVLECSDGVAVVMPSGIAVKCNVLSQLISKSKVCTKRKKIPLFHYKGEVKVPLFEIRSEIVEKISIYIGHHNDDWPPTLSVDKPLRMDLKESLSEWDYDFYANHMLVDGDMSKNDNAFLMLKASQYLECEPMRDFACSALANIVRTIKGEEDFYRVFKVTEPFTEDEKKKVCNNKI